MCPSAIQCRTLVTMRLRGLGDEVEKLRPDDRPRSQVGGGEPLVIGYSGVFGAVVHLALGPGHLRGWCPWFVVEESQPLQEIVTVLVTQLLSSAALSWRSRGSFYAPA